MDQGSLAPSTRCGPSSAPAPAPAPVLWRYGQPHAMEGGAHQRYHPAAPGGAGCDSLSSMWAGRWWIAWGQRCLHTNRCWSQLCVRVLTGCPQSDHPRTVRGHPTQCSVSTQRVVWAVACLCVCGGHIFASRSCSCCVVVLVYLLCACRVPIMHLSCICHAPVVYLPCTCGAMVLLLVGWVTCVVLSIMAGPMAAQWRI